MLPLPKRCVEGVGQLSFLLSAKAEAVLGSLLVIRNRTAHLACGLMFAVLVLLSVQGPERLPVAHRPIAVLTIAGTLAAVAGSRLLAPGAALAAARQVAASWWVVPVGRFTGALLVVLPCALLPVLVLDPLGASPVAFGASMAVYAASTTAFTCFLAPLIGSSASLTTGLAMVLFGAIPTQHWPFLGGFLRLPRDVLPLQWRACEMLTGAGVTNLTVFVAWILIAVVASGWSTTAVWDVGRRGVRESR